MCVFLEISIHTELYQLGHCPNFKSSNPTLFNSVPQESMKWNTNPLKSLNFKNSSP